VVQIKVKTIVLIHIQLYCVVLVCGLQDWCMENRTQHFRKT